VSDPWGKDAFSMDPIVVTLIAIPEIVPYSIEIRTEQREVLVEEIVHVPVVDRVAVTV